MHSSQLSANSGVVAPLRFVLLCLYVARVVSHIYIYSHSLALTKPASRSQFIMILFSGDQILLITDIRVKCRHHVVKALINPTKLQRALCRRHKKGITYCLKEAKRAITYTARVCSIKVINHTVGQQPIYHMCTINDNLLLR